MAKKKAAKAGEVIQGDPKDFNEQLKEARGDGKGGGIDPGKAGSAASKPPLTDDMKARDAQIKEREKYLRDNGIDPDHDRNFGGSGVKKVEKANIKAKQYQGLVTCTGVHGQTHEKISARIDLPTATGEHGVWLAFLAHHPNAIPGEFEIDPTNKADPMLRSSLE